MVTIYQMLRYLRYKDHLLTCFTETAASTVGLTSSISKILLPCGSKMCFHKVVLLDFSSPERSCFPLLLYCRFWSVDLFHATIIALKLNAVSWTVQVPFASSQVTYKNQIPVVAIERNIHFKTTLGRKSVHALFLASGRRHRTDNTFAKSFEICCVRGKAPESLTDLHCPW